MPWQSVRVSVSPDRGWLTIPELVDILGVSPGRIHRMVEERILLGAIREGAFRVPSDFVRDGAPLPELRGTVTVLVDAGFGDEEALDWLLEENDALGVAPIDALRVGRKAEVRRVAQSLAF